MYAMQNTKAYLDACVEDLSQAVRNFIGINDASSHIVGVMEGPTGPLDHRYRLGSAQSTSSVHRSQRTSIRSEETSWILWNTSH
jgi:hypothetical protein